MLKFVLNLFIVFFISLSFSSVFAQQGETSSNAENVVYLVSTQEMKPSGPVKGDYDRVKLALGKEFNQGLRGFSQEKLAFYVYTFTTDKTKAVEIKNRIIKVVPDAILTEIKESDLTSIK